MTLFSSRFKVPFYLVVLLLLSQSSYYSQEQATQLSSNHKQSLVEKESIVTAFSDQEFHWITSHQSEKLTRESLVPGETVYIRRFLYFKSFRIYGAIQTTLFGKDSPEFHKSVIPSNFNILFDHPIPEDDAVAFIERIEKKEIESISFDEHIAFPSQKGIIISSWYFVKLSNREVYNVLIGGSPITVIERVYPEIKY